MPNLEIQQRIININSHNYNLNFSMLILCDHSHNQSCKRKHTSGATINRMQSSTTREQQGSGTPSLVDGRAASTDATPTSPTCTHTCDLCSRKFKNRQGLSLHKHGHKLGKATAGLDLKAMQKIYQKRHNEKPKTKQVRQAYQQSARGKAKSKKAKAKYRSSEHGKHKEKETRKAYQVTARAKAVRKARERTPAAKAKTGAKNVAYRASRQGFLTVMMLTTKASAKRRGLAFDLDHDFFHQQAYKQGDLCYYSKLPMAFKSLSDWQSSPERVDPALGYTKDNVVLVCLEFNNAKQWTFEMFQRTFVEAHHLLNSNDVSSIATSILTAPVMGRPGILRQRMERRMIDDVEQKRCNSCQEWFSSRECRLCIRARQVTPRAKMMTLVRGTRNSAVLRGNRGRSDAAVHALDLDALTDMYLAQQGLCYYSNMPLKFSGDYTLSVERLDTSKGYTRGNCVLICIEFQGNDHSVQGLGNEYRTGNHVRSGGWSKDKFEMVRAHAISHYQDQQLEEEMDLLANECQQLLWDIMRMVTAHSSKVPASSVVQNVMQTMHCDEAFGIQRATHLAYLRNCYMQALGSDSYKAIISRKVGVYEERAACDALVHYRTLTRNVVISAFTPLQKIEYYALRKTGIWKHTN
ncbi:hypothetical protein JKP88DRAFT_243980 [Tribonema minus]|uniref:C2H2-type domain-containing protein n=1 Tax=Tribonema minus TaxID=303371 RepID=A0A836CI67_9STRA|nr:hypothetical protein JKP88DRAFT_243980 [Tribonema minus]